MRWAARPTLAPESKGMDVEEIPGFRVPLSVDRLNPFELMK